MKKTLVLILPVIALLFFVPSISLNDVFAEKLLVSAGKDVNAQFSFIDKISALESQILDKGANGFLSGITFSPDGSLIASASDESSQGDPGFVNVSFLINNGEPYTVFHDLGFYNFFSCEDISYAPTGELYCSTVNLDGIIIHKSTHSPGSHHDYSIYKSKHPTLPPELLQFYDLGYLGVEKDFEDQTSILPYKKKKGKELSIPQKAWNKLQSKIRIKVEHVIAQIKKFRINRDVFRNKLCRYDVISEIVCGIVNFKIRWKEEFITIP